MMFGFNNISIDKKSRFSFPAKYRDAFINSNENQIVITKDPQYPALKVYLGSEWDQISKKLSSLQGLDPVVRNLQWTILGNAYEAEFDYEGRMLLRIPSDLRNYAGIEDDKQIAIVGMGNKFEIWEEDNWKSRQSGGSLSTEIIDVVLPETVKSMSF